MAGGPRKFSEKIALLNQKQAEGNAAFESIMGEVYSIKTTSNSGSHLDMIDSLNNAGNNVKLNHTAAIDETIAYNEQINITYEHQAMAGGASQTPPTSTSGNSTTSTTTHYKSQSKQHKKLDDQNSLKIKNHEHHQHHQHHSHHNQHQLQHVQHQHQQQQQQQLIPNNNSYLQLPNQNDSFRRAHSDSSLHNSVNNTNLLSTQNAYTNHHHHHHHHNNNSHHLNQHHFNQQQASQLQPHTTDNGSLYAHQQQQQQQQQQLVYQQNQQQPQLRFHSPQPHQFQQQQQQQQQLYADFQQQRLQTNAAANNTNNSNIPFKNTTLPLSQSMSAVGNSNNTVQASSTPTSPNATNGSMNLQQSASLIDSLSNTSLNSSQQQQNYMFTKFKNEPTSPHLPPTGMNLNLLPNVGGNIYSTQQQSPQNTQLPSPSSPSQLPSPTTSPFAYPNNLSIQQQQQQYQINFQQQQQQQQQIINNKPDLIVNLNQANANTNNNNFLNPNAQLTTSGGSLPDLTRIQSQTNGQSQQYQKPNDYSQTNQINQLNYDFQLLQPDFQHNHIGPLKPTHNGSVSPTRGMSRYSPTHSNTNLGANRRPSPQRNHSPLASPIDLSVPTQLPLSTHQQVQSTPTSPMNPSMQTLPSLEFTINSQQISNCYSSLLNGSNMLNNNNASMYRSASNSNGLNGGNGGGESLPPSPQSQQSCFNSPQGSPGPLSISPQDQNPFTTNNYDIIQKKFDSINLDASNSTYPNPYTNPGAYNQSNIVLVPPPNGHMFATKPNHINKHDTGGGENSTSTGSTGTNCNGSTNNNSPNSIDSDCVSAAQIMSSRSGSLSSNGSGTHQLNSNGLYDEIEMHPSQPYQPYQNSANTLAANPSPNNNSNSNNTLNTSGSNSNIVNKTHKNSIPNIILTYSGDSIEEKNEILVKDLSNDDYILSKNDLDLEIFTETDPIDDQSLNNIHANMNYNEQTLFQNT